MYSPMTANCAKMKGSEKCSLRGIVNSTLVTRDLCATNSPDVSTPAAHVPVSAHAVANKTARKNPCSAKTHCNCV